MHKAVLRALGLSLLLLATTPARAGEWLDDWRPVGVGRLLVNDLFGDTRDRWHTGSGVLSFGFARDPDAAERLPGSPFDLVELRIAGAVLAPSRLRTPQPWDRPYAGVLSLGAHTHFAPGPFEARLGVDLVATGPQTHMSDLQVAVHDMLGLAGPDSGVLATQVPNGFHPTVSGELALPVALSGRLELRPFVSAQAGVETFVRAGADLLFGPAWSGLTYRDTTTGLTYRGNRSNRGTGLSLLVGADYAHVFSSVFLPADDGYTLTDRARLRAGMHWQGKGLSVFYGATWLGPEFTAQPEGQLVGALRIDVAF